MLYQSYQSQDITHLVLFCGEELLLYCGGSSVRDIMDQNNAGPPGVQVPEQVPEDQQQPPVQQPPMPEQLAQVIQTL